MNLTHLVPKVVEKVEAVREELGHRLQGEDDKEHHLEGEREVGGRGGGVWLGMEDRKEDDRAVGSSRLQERRAGTLDTHTGRRANQTYFEYLMDVKWRCEEGRAIVFLGQRIVDRQFDAVTADTQQNEPIKPRITDEVPRGESLN